MKLRTAEANVGREAREAPVPCRVAVVYEGSEARNQCLAWCDWMVRKFWDDVDFQFTWWGIRFVRDEVLRPLAVEEIGGADMLMVALSAATEIPREVGEVSEAWASRRMTMDGAVVLLLLDEDGAADPETTILYFKRLAARVRGEFLLCSPTSEHHDAEDCERSMARRAEYVTFELQEILRRTPPPPHWGINE